MNQRILSLCFCSSHCWHTHTPKNIHANTAMDGTYCVYLLKLDHPSKNRTYTGSTNHLFRRLRQHNGELSGGARYTRMVSENHKYRWEPICIVRGFKTKSEACSFEWHVKHTGTACKNTRPRRLGQLFSVCRSKGGSHLCLQWYQLRFKPGLSDKSPIGVVNEVTQHQPFPAAERKFAVTNKKQQRRAVIVITPPKVDDTSSSG